MLVLTRGLDEAILIGDDIRISVVQVNRHRGTVRIGIEAPRELQILREELLGRSSDDPAPPVRGSSGPSKGQ